MKNDLKVLLFVVQGPPESYKVKQTLVDLLLESRVVAVSLPNPA